MSEQRRLAAIVAADVVGYSRLMGRDEVGTARALREHRAAVDPVIAEHSGRIVKTTGDGLLLEFPSVVAAVRCAIAVQTLMAERNAGIDRERAMLFRIGVNVGDVLIEGDDILGDGVNIAARLEAIARPGGICLSQAVHDSIRGKIEAAFADGGRQTLKNIAEAVSVWHWTGEGRPGAAATGQSARDRPSVAVLPFDNLSADTDKEYFSAGITEDIIANLSKFRELHVISRNSSFAYKGGDRAKIGSELGADYPVEGSVRSAGARVRIAAQLSEVAGGRQIWTERYDRDLTDVFQLQDEITARIANAIDPAIRGLETRAALRKHPADLAAWDRLLRGLWHVHQFRAVANEAGRSEFESALSLDPQCAPAHAWLAMTHVFDAWFNWTETHAASLDKAHRAAAAAVKADDGEPMAYVAAALACFWTADIDKARLAADRALALNPNSFLANFACGGARNYAGDCETAVSHSLRALDLSPNDPLAWNCLGSLAHTYLNLHRYDDAVATADRAIALRRGYLFGRVVRTAALAHAGRHDEARAALQAIFDLSPDFSVARLDHYPLVLEAQKRLLLGGLEKAGLPLSTPTPAPTLTLPDKPSIAVLPFENMSGDPEQEYFADGIVEDIITALSRFKSLFVIARNSSFTYKGKTPDVRQVGRELGVRYVLEGSVRKAGNRVRITGQLIEAASNAHLWADRFEGPMDDIFTLQDKVTSSVVGIVEPTIQLSEIQRALVKPTGNLNAYDCYLRGVPNYNKWTRDANEEAHRLFSAALELDPNYAAALICLAYVHAQRWMQGWTDDRQREVTAGKRLQERALELAKDDQFVLAGSAYLHVQFGGDVATAVSLIDRAMHLNPNSSVTLEASTWVRIRAGDPELAIEHCLRAMQLNPFNQTKTPLAIAYFLLGREQEAVACIDEALINAPRALPALRFAATIKAGFGWDEEARQLVKRILEISPKATFNAIPGPWTPVKPEYERKWTDALRALVRLGSP